MEPSDKRAGTKGYGVVSARRAARLLGMDKREVRRLLQQATIKGRKTPERWEIPLSEVRRWARFRAARSKKARTLPVEPTDERPGMDGDRLISARQAARLLEMHDDRVTRLLQQTKIKGRKTPERWEIPISEVWRWARFRARPSPDLFTQAAAARELGISRQAVHQKVQKGRLETTGVGAQRLILKSTLEKELQKRKHEGWCGLKAVSVALGLTRPEVYRLVRSGGLRAARIGYYFFVPEDEVRRLQECFKPAKPASETVK